MIRREKSDIQEDEPKPKGFDDYELTLGDIMRGERATLGKSLLDVQRELKIKAPYIAAIENSDPTAFDTPGFIAGFVRSYARYLGLDPEWAFEKFSAESGFTTAHGMSAEALPARKTREERLSARPVAEAFAAPAVPFNPGKESVFASIEPRAIGSSLVLLALIAGLGYGAWLLLQEVQRVDLTPVEQAPTVTANIGSGGDFGVFGTGSGLPPTNPAPSELASSPPPSTDALERLYRPAALDVPVMVARDGPIAAIDPDVQGIFASGPSAEQAPRVGDSDLLVTDGEVPEVTLVAVRPTWVRVQTPSQAIVFEKVLEPGEEYSVPVTEETPVLRAGNAGALYFRVNGTLVGPAGQGGSVISEVQLASTDLSAAYAPANPLEDRELFELLTELGSPDVLPKPAAVLIPEANDLRISLVAVADSWVRVRDESGTVRFEGILPPGGVQLLPEDMGDATLRAGNSGSLYFRIGDALYGPAGTLTISNVPVTADSIRERYQQVSASDLGVTLP